MNLYECENWQWICTIVDRIQWICTIVKTINLYDRQTNKYLQMSKQWIFTIVKTGNYSLQLLNTTNWYYYQMQWTCSISKNIMNLIANYNEYVLLSKTLNLYDC